MNIFFSWKSCVILFLSGMGESLTLFLTPFYRVSVYFKSINVQVVHKYNSSVTNISKMMLENYTNKGEYFNYFTTQIQGLSGVITFPSDNKYLSI
jgi:hypothetical protein